MEKQPFLPQTPKQSGFLTCVNNFKSLHIFAIRVQLFTPAQVRMRQEWFYFCFASFFGRNVTRVRTNTHQSAAVRKYDLDLWWLVHRHIDTQSFSATRDTFAGRIQEARQVPHTRRFLMFCARFESIFSTRNQRAAGLIPSCLRAFRIPSDCVGCLGNPLKSFLY